MSTIPYIFITFFIKFQPNFIVTIYHTSIYLSLTVIFRQEENSLIQNPANNQKLLCAKFTYLLPSLTIYFNLYRGAPFYLPPCSNRRLLLTFIDKLDWFYINVATKITASETSNDTGSILVQLFNMRMIEISMKQWLAEF